MFAWTLAADDALSRGPVAAAATPLQATLQQLPVVLDAEVMDAPLLRPAGLLSAPPTSGSQPAGSDTHASDGKPLAFSIERIMARTPEPRSIPLPGWFPSAPVGKPDTCPSSLHCMIPLLPLGYEPGHRLSVAGLDPGHLDTALPAHADFLGFGLNYKPQQEESSSTHSPGQYKLFRPRVVNQSAFPTVGAVCYLNCGGDSGGCAPPAGLVNLHPMASYLLSARHKAFLADKSKVGLQAAERCPVSPSHVQIHNYMKDRDQIQVLTDKLFKSSATAARLSGPCPGAKPKVFTCEVCGKVSRAPEPDSGPGCFIPALRNKYQNAVTMKTNKKDQ